jgi:hypothetical protein
LDQRLINPYSIFENKSPGDEATKAPSYLLTLGKKRKCFIFTQLKISCIACWLKHFVQELNENPSKNDQLIDVTLDDILEGCLKRPNY